MIGRSQNEVVNFRIDMVGRGLNDCWEQAAKSSQSEFSADSLAGQN